MDLTTATIFTCKQCPFFSNLRSKLNFHTAKKHPLKTEAKKLKCSKCNFESGFSYHMKKHEERCGSKETILMCEDTTCDYKISSTFLLAKHEQKEHGITTRIISKKKLGKKALFKCQKCSYSTAHKHALNNHAKKCSLSDSESKCKHCDFTSYSSLVVKRHSVKNHGYQCLRCDFFSKSKSIYLEHKKSHPVTVKCSKDDCGFFGNRLDVQKHQEDIHGIMRIPELGIKKCIRCSYSTTKSIPFRRHILKCSKSDSITKCKHCEFKGFSPLIVSCHIKKEHGFSCGKCEFSSKSKIEFIQHKNTHPKYFQPRRCTVDDCNFTGSKYLMTKHMEDTHGMKEASENMKKCERCDFSTSNNKNLTRHWKLCSKTENLYTCEVAQCEAKFGTEVSLSTHNKRYHPELSLKKCHRCDYTNKSSDNWRSHLKSCLKSNELFHCTHCSHKYGTKAGLLKHLKMEHSDVRKELLHKCQRCDYSTKNFSSITKHEKNCISSENLFDCGIEQCEKKFGTEVSLSIHQKHKHPGFSVKKCKYCDYENTKAKSLENHTRSCRKNLIIHCPICNLKFSNQLMIKHKAESHNLSEFQCNLCSYKATNQDKMTIHINGKHLKLKKYKCENCDYKTAWLKSIKTHKKQCGSESDTQLLCDLCDFKTSSKYVMKSHMKTIHLKKEKLCCERCDYSTNDKCSITYHQKVCSKSADIHTCPHCGYRSGTKTGLVIHFSSDHPEIKQEIQYQKCPRCDHSAKDSGSINKHWKICSKSQTLYACGVDQCQSKFGTEITLSNHRKRHHPEFENGVKKCQRCDYTSNSFSQIKSHLKTCLLTDDIYSCVHCGHKSGTKYGLQIHLKSKHPDIQREISQKCQGCDYSSIDAGSIRRHQEICLKSLNLFECGVDKCERKFGTAVSLYNHQRHHHPGFNPKQCNQCDYASQSVKNMKNHLKNCLKSQDLYKCGVDECERKFGTETSLSYHRKLQHPDFNVKKCIKCDYTAKNAENLRNHIMSCSKSDEIFPCSYCGYKSGTSYGLIIHLKMKHPNERREHLKCERCDYTTNTRSSLDSHVQSCSTSDNLQTCIHCGFKSGTNLGRHYKISHPNLLKEINLEEMKCPNCDYATYNGKQLDKHVKKCLMSQMIECNVCDFYSTSQAILKKHFDTEHGNDTVNDPTYKSHCSIPNPEYETPMTRTVKESMVRTIAMKQANQKCIVKLVKCRTLGFIYN